MYFFKVYRGSKRSKTYKILTINKFIYKLENIEKNYSCKKKYKELKATNSKQKPSILTKVDKTRTYTQESVKLSVYNQNDKGEVMVTENQELEKESSKDSVKDENSIATEDIKKEKSKNIFELSYSTDKKLEKFEIDDFIKYVDTNYPKYTDTEKDKLLKDLIVLKSYRDKIEIKLNNLDAIDRLFDKIMLFCSIIAAIIVANKLMNLDIVKELKRELETNPEKNIIMQRIKAAWELFNKFSVDLFFVLFGAFIILAISIVLLICKRIGKNSLNGKLICLNNSIYTLETIKEKR